MGGDVTSVPNERLAHEFGNKVKMCAINTNYNFVTLFLVIVE